MTEQELNALTERVIGCAFQVGNTLGCGFLERVYENALAHELRLSSIVVESQIPLPVIYKGVTVGDYIADLLVERVLLIEVKATREHNEAFAAQCLNYLKAAKLPLCLLINFGRPKVDIRRLRANDGWRDPS
ncbi:GxxExxY protein [Planctomyces sp. SH-PL14]|uniref:GxxExxY protein n=1 Tax=Planctomyces sp. SH-PL14 TaxID=1632864 RepID=UPI00078EC8B4|nr:GxxExxY protein [Planctomyces sp. SH-PL14]AMV21116.1 hypothetical protein VT03_24650 [Planctomyces sp. SH-PL14]